ncbi:MAG: PTS sugar transporter subunit IIA [Nitrospirota bacterium]
MNLRVKDVAGLLSISQKTIYRMIKNETIPCFRVGGQWRFDRGEIASWIEDTRDIPAHVPTRTSSLADEESISVSEFLRRGGIYYNVAANTKEDAISSSLALIKEEVPQMDIRKLFNAIMEREKLCSTAVGHGIAFPHPMPFKEFASRFSSIALCYLDKPIPFGALDNDDVDTLFFIFPRNERRYLRILAKLSRLLKDEEIISAVKNFSPADKLYEVFARREAELFKVTEK